MSEAKALLREQEQALRDLADHLSAGLGVDLLETSVARGELTIRVPAERIVKVLTFLRDDGNCQFAELVDITGLDWPQRPQRLYLRTPNFGFRFVFSISPFLAMLAPAKRPPVPASRRGRACPFPAAARTPRRPCSWSSR